MPPKTVVFAGNPNVGKSTLFNALTGLRQHTGNWAGKTVTGAQGRCAYKGQDFTLIDLPGCYSLTARSGEEEAACGYLLSGRPDAVVVVCDATCLERNLQLALQILEITPNVVLCVNLMDEAKKKKIRIDLAVLSGRLGIAAVGTSARNKGGLETLMEAVSAVCDAPPSAQKRGHAGHAPDAWLFAGELYRDAVTLDNETYMERDARIDAVITGRRTAFPILFLTLLGILWITIVGANVPSQLIGSFFFGAEEKLLDFFRIIHAPPLLGDMLVLGVYRVLAWVVSVMLPPMAIFFPLFTLLEDAGILPRIAFNLDHFFKKSHSCGKQALTMCMGFGCNAAGVVGCRIISSPREKLIAIITNNFVPCNGRFPAFIAIISMFFIGMAASVINTALSALLLASVLILGVAATLLASKILSKTILKGVPSFFTLELPPYRRPQIAKVLLRSLLDRTLFVLGRAVAVAAPAGLIIWVMANVETGGLTLLARCSGFLDPFARLLGMDGVILLAFILGFPANEIVIPIVIMAYMAEGSLLEISSLSELKILLLDNGWTWVTAVSVMLFTLLHWPCSTTCLTIYKETKSAKWTAVSAVMPTIAGLTACFLFASVAKLL